MADEPIQEVVTTEIQQGTTRIGIGQLNNPTPSWVNWVFRTEFLINKAIGVWLSSQGSLDLAHVKNIILWTTIIDGFVWGIGRFVGISKEEIEK